MLSARKELADILKRGDYNIHPNSTYKRFFESEAEVDEFIRRNPDRGYTKTSVDLPEDYVLKNMERHPDFGVGQAFGIDVYDNPEFYDMFLGGSPY